MAFGLFSLPVGWFADRLGRRNLLATFFVGCGSPVLGLLTASSSTGFAIWLLVLGVLSAIYHPIGTAMLVTHARHTGRGAWGQRGVGETSVQQSHRE